MCFARSRLFSRGAVGAVCCTVLFLACRVRTPSSVPLHSGSVRAAVPEATSFHWRRYAGTRLRVCFPYHASYRALKAFVPEFESLTGIAVEIDWLQYARMHDKQVLELSKPRGDYDLIAMLCTWKTEYASRGLLRSLDSFFQNPSLCMPHYDFEDLIPVYVETIGYVGGRKPWLGGPGAFLCAVPFGAETSILAYRKDIFHKYRIKVPENYDELLDACKRLRERAQLYGLASRGASGQQALHAYLLHAAPFGAKVLDDSLVPAFHRSRSIATLRWMQEMFAYGPPGMASFAQNEALQAFLQGQTGMYLDTNMIGPLVRDPTRSAIRPHHVGFALHPMAQVRAGEVGGFGLAIPHNSAAPEAAFLLLQWITAPQTGRRVVEQGALPFRQSQLADRALRARFAEFEVLERQLAHCDPDWRPVVPTWGELGTLLGIGINEVLTGVSEPEEAMSALVLPARRILRRHAHARYVP